ncbi:hypothetical protein OVA29_01500 [Exiguobacterium sp. SL14]|nr:hypothetical protein [Exiguobacterium sp. SL14]MCY1689685.1 hypothetical protein [Exiguobacterium sp. SL14]
MERLGHLISAYFRGVLVVWAILLVALGYFAYQLPDRLEGNGFTRDGDFQRVETTLDKDFDQDPHTIIVLFEDQENLQQTMVQDVERFRDIKGVGNVTGPVENPQAIRDDKGYVTVGVPNLDSKWATRSPVNWMIPGRFG